MANGFRTSSPDIQLIEDILQGPGDISQKFFGPGGFEPTGREGGETASEAFLRLFSPTQPRATTGGLDLDKILTALPGLLRQPEAAPKQEIVPRGTLQRAGPVVFETGEGGRQIVRQVTGGFAPGTIGHTIQAMLPQILASLTGGAAGGPTRENLLAPRIGDIEAREQAARNALLNRFAALGRSATGSTTTEALGELGRQAGIARQGAFGDVDTLLANIANARQGNLMSLLQFLFQSGRA